MRKKDTQDMEKTITKERRPAPRMLEEDQRDNDDRRRLDADLKNKIFKKLNNIYYKQGYSVGRDQLTIIVREQMGFKVGRDIVEEWLDNQKIHQLYKMPRTSKGAASFKPIKPFKAMSTDLIDFTNRQSKQYRYILTVMDNFSRYLWAEPLTEKTEKATGVGLAKIFERIKEEFNNPDFGYIISDRGGEFQGYSIEVFKKYNIRKVTTIAGAPQSNAMVERSNGTIKRLMKKYVEINGGGWSDALPKIIKIYNDLPNRSTGFKPKKAIQADEEMIKQIRESVKERQIEDRTLPPENFKVGMIVRVKKPKGKLGKSSDVNWSSTLHEIRDVRSKTNHATKYRVKGRKDDEWFVRQDLQVINNPESIEEIPRTFKANKLEKVNEAIKSAPAGTAKKRNEKPAEPRKTGRVRKATEKPSM